jgi:hypothetical protein
LFDCLYKKTPERAGVFMVIIYNVGCNTLSTACMIPFAH